MGRGTILKDTVLKSIPIGDKWVKRFAYIFRNGDYIKTNVWEVLRGKKYEPRNWENIKYFSTHRKIENRRELVFVNKKPNSYFKYKNLINAETHEGYEETLAHELCKEILSELNIINFKIKNKNFTIYVTECEVEREVKTPNGDYYVDLLFKFDKSEPELLKMKWNGIVAVEVCVTHKTSEVKKKDLLDAGIPVIEFKVSEKFQFDETKEITEDMFIEKKNFITKYYEKEIYAELLADPTSEKYIKIIEIEGFKRKISELEKQINEQGNELYQSKVMVSKLNAEISNQSRLLTNKDRELTVIRAESHEFKKSFWYKLYRKLK